MGHRLVTGLIAGCALLAAAPALAVDFIEVGRLQDLGVAGDATGSSVAVLGSLAVVCSERRTGTQYQSGECVTYRSDAGTWSVVERLNPNLQVYGGRFGTSVAISADRIVVGANAGCCPGTVDGGRVYVFDFFSGYWQQEAMLVGANPADDDFFGSSVAIDATGTLIAVGAPGDDDAGFGAGAVYLFRKVGSSWTLEQKLTSSQGVNLGSSVGVAGEYAVGGGMNSAVRIYKFNGNQWLERQQLVSPDPGSTQYGVRLAFDGSQLVVGAPQADATAIGSGALYLYRKTGQNWTYDQRIVPADAGGRVGQSVALFGSEIIAGASGNDTVAPDGGAAYVFRKISGTWLTSQILTAGDASGAAHFGASVAYDGTSIFAGSPDSSPGRAYVFEQRVIHPPVADAGPGGVAECNDAGGGLVVLDASGSSDPDSHPGTNDDIVLYEWLEGSVTIGFGQQIAPSFPVGAHPITLRVTDRLGATSTDTTSWTIVNDVPPVLSVSIAGGVLWPPNHRLVDVSTLVTTIGGCGPSPVTLESLVSSEPDDAPGAGDGETTLDVQDAVVGAFDRIFRLRAERSSSGAGRTYTATYRVTEPGGGGATASASIVVPLLRDGLTDPIGLSVIQTPAGTRVDWTSSVAGAVYNAVRGYLSQLKDEPSDRFIGDVTCIESRSPDTTTAGLEDTGIPALGNGFFYLVEYDDGARSGYGEESAGKPRVLASGDCP